MQNIWPVTNPVTIRASAALPAAGAYDATPLEVAVASIDWITFYIAYTRGGAGGDMRFRIQWSPYAATVAGVENWFTGGLFAAGAVASGADSVSNLQREAIEYGSTGAGAETVIYGPLEIRGTIERLRVAYAESGAVGTPGTTHIVAVMR